MPSRSSRPDWRRGLMVTHRWLGITGVPGVVGQYFYLQGITLDGTNPTPPWTSTNPATTIWTH